MLLQPTNLYSSSRSQYLLPRQRLLQFLQQLLFLAHLQLISTMFHRLMGCATQLIQTLPPGTLFIIPTTRNVASTAGK